MTRLARKTSLLAALYLLTSAATVYSKCAWVLWVTAYRMSSSKPDQPISDMTVPGEAFTTKDECDEARRRHRAIEDDRRRTDASKQQYFSCLPDTVDPRGPKGK